MRNTPKTPDYNQLTHLELNAAASAPDIKSRCAHLNRAGVLAYLGECARDEGLTSQSRVKSWERKGTFAYAKRAALLSALQHCNYNLKATASRLEISRSSVYRMIEAYCIKLPVEIVLVETEREVEATIVDSRTTDRIVNSRLEFLDRNLMIITRAR